MANPDSSLPTITTRREIVEISGGRKLYNYTFDLDGETAKPLTADDIVPALTVESPAVQKPTDG